LVRNYTGLDTIAYEIKLNTKASVALDSASTPFTVALKDRDDYGTSLLLDHDIREGIEARRLTGTYCEIGLYSERSPVDMEAERISTTFGMVHKDGDRYKGVINGRTGGSASST
ncbi:hypothetical protein BG011_010207, partial [Mortierella polycephala]